MHKNTVVKGFIITWPRPWVSVAERIGIRDAVMRYPKKQNIAALLLSTDSTVERSFL